MSNVSMKRRLRVAAALGGVCASGILAAGAAAATPTGDYADFKYCPVNNPSVQTCTFVKATSGSFKLGYTTVPVAPKTIVLQGGSYQNPDTGATTFVNASGAPTISPVPLFVPGGLTGLLDSSQFNAPLLNIFKQFVASTNDVYATPEQVGPIGYSFLDYITGSGPALTLPVRIKLTNPFLGSNCYIGSSSNPVRIQLKTGTTAPPRPNTPITGSPGQINLTNDGDLLTSTGFKAVDNAFSVPAATDCGYTILDKWLITGAVNLKTGLPSAAGRNSAILQGNLKQASRNAVVASSQ